MPKAAIAELKALQGSGIRGTVKFTEASGGVKIEAEIAGFFGSSTNAIHIHEKGDCTAVDGSSAGADFNRLGNITSNEQGVAKIALFKKGASLSGAKGIIGRSVIIHENADDLKTQPNGAAGSRIACGVIGWQ